MYSRWTVHKSSFWYCSCFCLTPCRYLEEDSNVIPHRNNSNSNFRYYFIAALFLLGGQKRSKYPRGLNLLSKNNPPEVHGLIGSKSIIGLHVLATAAADLSAAPLHHHALAHRSPRFHLQPNTTRVVSNHGFRSHYAYDCLAFQHADLDESDHWSGLEEEAVVMSKRCVLHGTAGFLHTYALEERLFYFFSGPN